jgi:hypothetical protein
LTQAPVHSRMDDNTDYCLPGTQVWEAARKCRLERGEGQVGKILGGQWPPVLPWEKSVVIRKDIDFRKEEQERKQRVAVSGWVNSMYQDGNMYQDGKLGEWIW